MTVGQIATEDEVVKFQDCLLCDWCDLIFIPVHQLQYTVEDQFIDLTLREMAHVEQGWLPVGDKDMCWKCQGAPTEKNG